jgi:hypothetical protein
MHHMCETWSQHTWCLCTRPGFGPLKPGCDNRAARGAGVVDVAARGAGRIDGAARGAGGVDGAARGAGEVVETA